jgi:hypothetical protein
MKRNIVVWAGAALSAACLLAGFLSCRGALAGRCAVEVPEPPEVWRELLGEPRWLLEWVDGAGEKASRELADRFAAADIEVNEEWAAPVTAWPFWPERGLEPGLARPAGALFPLD